MIEKLRRLIDSKITPFFLFLISMLINDLPIWLSLCLMVIASLLYLRITDKQPLPLWGEEGIRRWNEIRQGGERQFILAPSIVIPTFLLLYVFLLINIVAIWDHTFSSDIMKFDAWYSAIAIVLWCLIYITRKGLWSLREKTYKVSLAATQPSNKSFDASPRSEF
jgi:hypothetical protein